MSNHNGRLSYHAPSLAPVNLVSTSMTVDPLIVDHTEISLDDVDNDSPILRAAIANLERRTVKLRKLSKTALRAATDARCRILGVMDAEDVLDDALRELAMLAPSTLDKLRQGFLSFARERLYRHRREQATMIEQNIERPLAQIIELCRSTLDTFKAFESESKSFYSHTQKWLSNRALPEAGGSQPNSTNLGSDNGQPGSGVEKLLKQERSDEKQKLRQLRFEHTRLELYKAVFKLHGGEVETELLQCMLRLAKWQAEAPQFIWGKDWPESKASGMLATLTAGSEEAIKAHSSQAYLVTQRSRELEKRIQAVEVSLSKAGDGIDTGIHSMTDPTGTNTDSATLVNEHETSSAKATGHKIRNFFGALGKGVVQGSPASNKMQGGGFGVKESSPFLSGSDTSFGQDIKRKVSIKLGSGRGGGLKSPRIELSDPIFRGPSPAVSNATESPDASRRAVELPSSPMAADGFGVLQQDTFNSLGSDPLTHTARAASEGSSSVDRPESNVGLGLGPIIDEPTPSPNPARTPAPAKPVLPGQERKKEGVLWVMSKPITGPAGSEAPRSANRATWRECWVVLSGSGHIGEYADWKDAKILEPSNPLIDLRFATVREARGVDRRFTFEVVTRDSRRFFQAPDEATMKDWTRAIAKAIESLLNGTSSVRKLDRAVKTIPFQGSSTLAEEDPSVDDWGSSAARAMKIASQRAFSQSMTDLTGKKLPDSNNNKAYKRASVGGRRGGHLSTLSESYTSIAMDDKHHRSGSRHERGISNKTPISGYMRKPAPSNEGPTEPESEIDRRIEEMVHNSYGRSSYDASSSLGKMDTSAHASPQVPEMGAFTTKPARATELSTSTKHSRAAEISIISRRPENSLCADCRDPDPRWASWALADEPCCIFICISCSGVHRSLGVQTSRVKSIDLDDWTEEQLDAARKWGNVKANELWEHKKPSRTFPAQGDRSEFWRKKYIEQAWKRTEQKTPKKMTRSSSVVERETPKEAQATSATVSPTSRPSGPRPLPGVEPHFVTDLESISPTIYHPTGTFDDLG